MLLSAKHRSNEISAFFRRTRHHLCEELRRQGFHPRATALLVAAIRSGLGSGPGFFGVEASSSEKVEPTSVVSLSCAPLEIFETDRDVRQHSTTERTSGAATKPYFDSGISSRPEWCLAYRAKCAGHSFAVRSHWWSLAVFLAPLMEAASTMRGPSIRHRLFSRYQAGAPESGSKLPHSKISAAWEECSVLLRS